MSTHQRSEKPNIVFVVTDQQRFDTIAALGFDGLKTPHLDRLVREGVSFSQCHVTAPSCAPSRASLFTGQYPHGCGVLKNADPWEHSWVEDLAESGYHCVNVGKMHTWPFTAPCGFHERFVVENKDRYLEGRWFFDEWDKALAARGLVKQQRELYRQRDDYFQKLGAFTWDLPAELQSDNFVGNFASWWLRQRPPTEPLFLQVGFPGPHPPYDPTPEALAEYAEMDLPLQEVTAEDLEGQPMAYHGMRVHNAEIDHDSVVHQLEPSEQARLDQRRHYHANVAMIGEQVEQIMEALDDQGYLENTIVIFTSDHGDCLTDHGHSQKWTMYDQVTRVPLLVWAPSRYAGGRTVDDLVSLFDVGPTILDMAGVDVPENFQARSLLPAIEGDESWRGRDAVFAEQVRDGNFTTADYQVMVRTADWKLVHIIGSDALDGGSEGQLFDLNADPGEQANLWGDPDHAAVKQALMEKLLEWRLRSGAKLTS